MTNKYLTKVCVLLRPPHPVDTKPVDKKKGALTKVKKRSVKIRKHNGDTTYRSHKVK